MWKAAATPQIGVPVRDNWNTDLNSVCSSTVHAFSFRKILFGGKFWPSFSKGYSSWLSGVYGKRAGRLFSVQTRIKLSWSLYFTEPRVLPRHCTELLYCSLLKRFLCESLYLYQQIKGRALCQLETSWSFPSLGWFIDKSLLGGMDLFYMHLIPL